MRFSKSLLTAKRLRQALRENGISLELWKEWAYCSPAEFVEWNPQWTEQDFKNFELPDILNFAASCRLLGTGR